MQSQIAKIFSKVNDRLILFRYIYPFVRKNKERVITKENTLCLFCQPRGGSTWLSEILLNIPKSVLIDEPLWRGKVAAPFSKPDYYTRKVKKIADLDFFYNQYIPEGEQWVEAKAAFQEILSGQTISIGLYDEQDLKKLEYGNFYITKFNYANLLAPWLINQFDFNAILLTRHPCAVISSQLKLPAWKNIDPAKATGTGNFPYHEHYASALKKIGKIDSREKYLALIWALGFRNTAMHQYNNKKWLTIAYESLLTNFRDEINRINERFSFSLENLNIDSKKPSKSTRPGSIISLQNDEQLSSWKSNLTKKQIAIILKVLDQLDIDIYSEQLEPDYNSLYSISQNV
jgi:hypothetical protein